VGDKLLLFSKKKKRDLRQKNRDWERMREVFFYLSTITINHGIVVGNHGSSSPQPSLCWQSQKIMAWRCRILRMAPQILRRRWSTQRIMASETEARRVGVAEHWCTSSMSAERSLIKILGGRLRTTGVGAVKWRSIEQLLGFLLFPPPQFLQRYSQRLTSFIPSDL
jgi:hypothetical protein